MRSILIILLFPVLLFSQTPLEKIAVTTGATVGYALLDVVLYPIAERNNMVNEYRMFQGVAGSLIFLELKNNYGLKTAISFGVNVISGVPDLIYYGFRPSEFNNNLNHLKFLPTAGHNVKKADVYSSSVLGYSFTITLNF